MERVIEAFAAEMGDGFFTHLIFHYTIVFGCFVLTMVLVLADLYFAITTARKLGEKVRSHKMRRTIEKLTRYWAFQLVAAAIGSLMVVFPWYGYPYLCLAATIGVSVVEFVSYKEHWRRRKDHMSKIPEALQSIVDFCGGDEIKDIIKEVALRHLASKTEK